MFFFFFFQIRLKVFSNSKSFIEIPKALFFVTCLKRLDLSFNELYEIPRAFVRRRKDFFFFFFLTHFLVAEFGMLAPSCVGRKQV